jgi:hypothetical protein
MEIAKAVEVYGVLKENISALEAKVKAVRPFIDAYLKEHPTERETFGDWDLVCSTTKRIVTDMKRLERKVGKRVLKECQREELGTQVKVVRTKQVDIAELEAVTETKPAAVTKS